MTDKFYTGIGSRTTPTHALAKIRMIARDVYRRGFILRSGGAEGADSAFEAVPFEFAAKDGRAHQIYLPWGGFNGRMQATLKRATVEAQLMARTVHPMWSKLSPGAKLLHARNCHQVLGEDLKTPSQFVVCWTPDGCESEATRTEQTGGTATAIVLADRHGIPVFNLYNLDAVERLVEHLNSSFKG